jgi:hypothetical protein
MAQHEMIVEQTPLPPNNQEKRAFVARFFISADHVVHRHGENKGQPCLKM